MTTAKEYEDKLLADEAEEDKEEIIIGKGYYMNTMTHILIDILKQLERLNADETTKKD